MTCLRANKKSLSDTRSNESMPTGRFCQSRCYLHKLKKYHHKIHSMHQKEVRKSLTLPYSVMLNHSTVPPLISIVHIILCNFLNYQLTHWYTNYEPGKSFTMKRFYLVKQYAFVMQYSHLLNTSPGWHNSQGWVKVENQGLNSSQGWDRWKT